MTAWLAARPTKITYCELRIVSTNFVWTTDNGTTLRGPQKVKSELESYDYPINLNSSCEDNSTSISTLNIQKQWSPENLSGISDILHPLPVF